jgi:hypothetical protein
MKSRGKQVYIAKFCFMINEIVTNKILELFMGVKSDV